MKTFIQNRKGQKLCVLVEGENNKKGLAFVMHGLWSNKDRPSTVSLASTFWENGYMVIKFDATNSSGESEGEPEKATISSFYEDLEDVIRWSSTQPWYKEPFMLAGSSLGGIATGLFAENFPQKIRALVLLAPVVSGELSLSTKSPETRQNWKKTGYDEKIYDKAKGVKKMLPWSHMEDRLKYNLITGAKSLIMPVIILVGDRDETCPLAHQKKLLDVIPGSKTLEIIPGGYHGSREPTHLESLKEKLADWIKKI